MSDKRSSRNPISALFSFIWGALTWLRRALANIILLVIIVVIVVAISKHETDMLPDSFALYLAPSGFLVDERQPVAPLAALSGTNQYESETLVTDVVNAIDQARADSRVSHIVLDLNHLLGGGLSKLHEIGLALQTFKDSGKQIIAISDQYSQSQYYLASHADNIYLHDMGHVMLTGFGSYRTYYKDAIDTLGLNFHIFRAGQFKDAVEPYIRNDMSDASREHNSQWINHLWDLYTSRIETQRSLPVGAVDNLIRNTQQQLTDAQGDPAQMALAAGLVDQVSSRQQIRAELIDQFGYDHNADSFKSVNWYRYLHHQQPLPLPGKTYIGVINATGTIYDGEQPPGTVGSETFVKLLRQARDDSDIKALVVRIDSPGGSAFASEVIRSEIQMVRDSGIPVLVSMGSVAASGGYWIATSADEIWALPSTITGSIGVYSIIPTLNESLKKLGIHTDGIGTTPLAGAMNPALPMSEKAAFVLQSTVDGTYRRFLKTVANARDLTQAQVDQIGQGRVWSGAKAFEIGLVDKLGTLDDTIKAAAEYAELKQWDVKTIERALTPFEQFMQQLSNVTMPLPESVQQSLSTLESFSQAAGISPALSLEANTVYAQCLDCTLWSDR
ncbi:signal peptide peptidase SppA [Gilvimarinus sp. SDUM040013]|uniref:Signal peptide peptidase SppA n=1 Tax=Gilvimarinus gilvus TaxID=3058038 RepID=A0ABU4S0I9_9GAMM|nr:signal peptide peptidase SppA [Gilvimarinus sp. SDUM040013]MDO3388797.1 signal peptide peptidase SppA [Gilvimarinus sp. SDUM040013]MDX6850550.1 signal peptide peptidase SppA [Gilvimarinus sp. SDUM040013]